MLCNSKMSALLVKRAILVESFIFIQNEVTRPIRTIGDVGNSGSSFFVKKSIFFNLGNGNSRFVRCLW